MRVLQGKVTRAETFITWRRVIKSYSSMSLTKESDRFAALAGLAQRFKDVLQCRYLAGLWDDYEELPQLLLWMQYATSEDAISKVPDEAERLRGIPTWSWASIYYPPQGKGSGWHGAHYSFLENKRQDVNFDPRVKIIRVTVDGNPDDLMNPPGKMSIVLEGFCVLNTLVNVSTVYPDLVASTDTPEQLWYLFMATRFDANRSEGKLCLLLQRLPCGRFERFGVASISPDRYRELFEKGKVMEVELV
ncbi:hypothetical protein QBC41DRAFT_325248 [Cercophora samala]|uniref:Uncharacterized protein n=1 Tax=Cercophora samala TaxID=330535 RepID=A0AA39ZA38_9PEZI|nr:hypothetical protein QBC41DRAFT_325248 [Cercophora samala]